MRMPIPDDWSGEYCKYAICWPKSQKWEIILRGLATEATRGFFWDERTGSVLDVLAVVRETMDYNLQLKEVIVACGDTGLAQIAQAITLLANRQCCDNITIGPNGFFGDIIVQPGSGQPVQIYGEDPPIGLGPGEYPPNYEDVDSYNVDKCRIANRIVDGWVSTIGALAGLGVVNFAGLVAVAGLVIAGIIVFPPAGFTILFAALGAAGFSAGLLGALAAGIEGQREDIVCALYQGESTSAIVGSYADLLDTIIASIPATGVVGTALKTVALVLANSETLNLLFSGAPALGYDEADCSGCEEVACCSTFDTDLDGWFKRDSIEGFTGAEGASFTWVMGDAVLVGAVGEGGLYRACIEVGDLNCPIVSGEDLVFRMTEDNSGASFNVYCYIWHDGTLTRIQAATRPFGGCEAFDLEPYVGETLQGVILELSRSTAFTRTFEEIGSTCEACV